MIIGTSRVGIGRIGIRSANATILELLTGAYIKDYNYYSVLTSANIVTITEPYVLTGVEIVGYAQRICLTSGSILGPTLTELLTSGQISAPVDVSIFSNAYICSPTVKNVLTTASILGPLTTQLLTNCAISGPRDITTLTNAYIAEIEELSMASGGYIAAPSDIDFETGAFISALRINTMPTNCYILDQHYWALGPDGALINLSGKVADPKTDGFGLKMKKQGVESGRHVSLLDGGIGGGEYTFYVYFKTDTERQTFQNSINNDAEDYRLHIGRSDRFYHVKKISTEPEKVKGAAGPVQKVTCWMEDPGMYHTFDQGIDLGACSLPQDGTSKYNYGSSLAPFLFRIGGQYNAGLQLTLPFVQCIEGSTIETSLALGPGLLSNEYAELTLCGWHEYYLTHTYSDLYSNNNYWQYDAVQSLCSLAGGQVSVPAGGWFYYKFQGYPTKENIRLIATITKSGSPIIQYSMDGSTWYTSITAAEIISGVQTTYDLTGTEKRSTIYIRFYSPAGSSMTIQDVAFSMERDISSQYAQMPSCPAGETRKIRVTGSGSTKAKISTTFRSRWHAQ